MSQRALPNERNSHLPANLHDDLHGLNGLALELDVADERPRLKQRF